MESILKGIERKSAVKEKLLAVLVDPEKFSTATISDFLSSIPIETTHFFVGGSTVSPGDTGKVVTFLKNSSDLPVVLFPGDCSQICQGADALLFLSLISGRNPEYLIGQQVKAVAQLKDLSLEVIPTGYILIEGGRGSDVEKITNTRPLSPKETDLIVDTALAGEYLGKKLIYLEAGSGAKSPVSPDIITEVKRSVKVPVIVGGGINSYCRLEAAFDAGADMVVIGNALEAEGSFDYAPGLKKEKGKIMNS